MGFSRESRRQRLLKKRDYRRKRALLGSLRRAAIAAVQACMGVRIVSASIC
jgi:hypothetical protein